MKGPSTMNEDSEVAAGNPPRHPATDTCDDTCPTWLHSRATCCHFHPASPTSEQPSAGYDALVLVAERIAYEHASAVDGEFGCCHDEAAFRSGGRVPEFDDDEFQPIPDDCPGQRILSRHLAAIDSSRLDPAAATEREAGR